MLPKLGVLSFLFVVLFGVESSRHDALAQVQRPDKRFSPRANICVTEPGWCPIQGGAPDPAMMTANIAIGVPCQCFVPPRTWLPGTTRSCRYAEPVSPYLNPHRECL